MAEDLREPTAESEGSRTGGAAEAPPDLRAELEAAQARADEHYRSWQRSAADFANFKRRVDEEKRFAERWLLKDLLPVLDDFERAWATLPHELRGLTWIEGLWQVNARLLTIVQQHGLTPIDSQARAFDPVEHEAVLREDDADPAEPTEVVAELQRGYRLHDRVLRAALVKVGRPKRPAGPGDEAATGEGAPAQDRPPADSSPADGGPADRPPVGRPGEAGQPTQGDA